MANAIKNEKTGSIKKVSKKKVYNMWEEQLNRNENGKIKNTFNNFKIILENDIEFLGKIKLNEFSNRPYFDKNILDDNTITEILIKIEKKYDGINNRKILEQVVDLIANENKYNPIKEYLDSLKWDKVPRMATALSDYFGCEHSKYNEYCFRVFLNGAISRALKPGCKFDYMLTLYGDQRTREKYILQIFMWKR